MANSTHAPLTQHYDEDGNLKTSMPNYMAGQVNGNQTYHLYNPKTRERSVKQVIWVPTPVPFEAQLQIIDKQYQNPGMIFRDILTNITYYIPQTTVVDIMKRGIIAGGVVRGTWQVVKNRSGFTLDLITPLPPMDIEEP